MADSAKRSATFADVIILNLDCESDLGALFRAFLVGREDSATPWLGERIWVGQVFIFASTGDFET